MRSIICNMSALELYRRNAAGIFLDGVRATFGKVPSTPLSNNDLQDLKSWGLPDPLHALVGSWEANRGLPGVKYHLGSGTYPTNSFIMIAPRVAVVSPELLFVQMACKLDLVELIVLDSSSVADTAWGTSRIPAAVSATTCR